MKTENEEIMTFRDILGFYFKHQFKILVIFFTTTVIVTALVYYFPEKYEVSSKLMVKAGRENASISPTITNPSIWTIGKQMKEIMNSETEILGSTFLVEQLVKDLGVDFFDPSKEPPKTIFQKLRAAAVFIVKKVKSFFLYIAYSLDILREITPFEEAVLGIKKNIYVATEKDSNIINVIYKTPNPDSGKIALNRLVELYLENRINVHKNERVHTFFQSQVERYETQLKETGDNLKFFKKSKGIVSLENQRDILLSQYLEQRQLKNDLSTRVHELNTKIKELSREQSSLEKDEVVSKKVGKNPLIYVYKEKLLNLELQRNKLLQSYMDDSFVVKTLEKNIAELKGLLAKENENVLMDTVTGSNNIYKNLDNEIIVAKTDLSTTMTQLEKREITLASLKKELDKLNFYETEINRLSRDQSTVEDNYLLYKKKAEEARIQDALDRSRIVSISIASPAISSMVPLMKMGIIPRKLYYIMIAMLASLAAGAMFSLLIDYYDRRITSERDIKNNLNIDVLGTIFNSKAIGDIIIKGNTITPGK